MIFRVLFAFAFLAGLILVLATDPRAQMLRDDVSKTTGFSLQ
jgi:hypothetical protein